MNPRDRKPQTVEPRGSGVPDLHLGSPTLSTTAHSLKCVDLLARPLQYLGPSKKRLDTGPPGAVPSGGQGCVGSCIGATGPIFPVTTPVFLHVSFAGGVYAFHSHSHIAISPLLSSQCPDGPHVAPFLPRALPCPDPDDRKLDAPLRCTLQLQSLPRGVNVVGIRKSYHCTQSSLTRIVLAPRWRPCRAA